MVNKSHRGRKWAAAILIAMSAWGQTPTQVDYPNQIKNKPFVSITDSPYKAKCDGVTNDANAIQRAIDGAGTNGYIKFPSGNCIIGTGLTFYSGQHWVGQSGPQLNTGQTTLTYTGTVGLPLLSPHTRSQNSKNLTIELMTFEGNFRAAPVVELYRTSYSTFIGVSFFDPQAGSSGLVVDAATSFVAGVNVFLNSKWDTSGATGVTFQNGANNNQIIGGACVNGNTCIKALSSSVDNTVIGTDCENQAVSCFVATAAVNKFYSTSCDDAIPICFDLSDGGVGTVIRDPNIAPTVTTSVKCPSGDASCASATVETFSASTTEAEHSWANVRQTASAFSLAANYFQDVLPSVSTAAVHLFHNYNIANSGALDEGWYDGTNSHNRRFFMDFKTGNFSGTGSMSAGTDGSFHSGSSGFYRIDSTNYKMTLPFFVQQVGSAAGVTNVFFDPTPQSGTSILTINFLRNVTTSGARNFNIYKGDGSATVTIGLNAATGEGTFQDITVSNGGAPGHAVCLTAGKKVGYCSTTVDASGLCTCN